MICSEAVVANTFRQRALGLMFRKEWKEVDGFLLSPCNAIHTFWMRMDIDVCFLDREKRVVKTVSRLKPWRMVNGGKGCRDTLELPAGKLELVGTEPGDKLAIEGP